VHKTTSTDDKRLQSTLKRLGVNTIPGIEEVLLINDDQTVLQFNNPKVQASIAANTYVVSGPSQQKSFAEVAPGMAGMGGANLAQMMAQMQGMGGMGVGGGPGAPDDEDDDDDDVPDLVENFDQA
jgi:nascent polypeptide-associated complex subunit beta